MIIYFTQIAGGLDIVGRIATILKLIFTVDRRRDFVFYVYYEYVWKSLR